VAGFHEQGSVSSGHIIGIECLENFAVIRSKRT
jgi:hypothetical protein